jgi:hypothetical protein
MQQLALSIWLYSQRSGSARRKRAHFPPPLGKVSRILLGRRRTDTHDPTEHDVNGKMSRITSKSFANKRLDQHFPQL